MAHKSLLKQLLRPLLGILLIVFLFNSLDQSQLHQVMIQADWAWFLVAFIALIISNLFSVWRWQVMTVKMGLPIRFAQALLLYAQGVTANTVLPGGIVGGDVWRTLGLVKLGQCVRFHHADAAASVLLERVGGLWSLAMVALLSLILSLAYSYLLLDGTLTHYYMGLLCLVCVAPLLCKWRWCKWADAQTLLAWSQQWANKWLRNGLRTLSVISRNIHLLVITLLQSLLVQLFAILALYACLRAVGQDLPYPVVAAVSFAIFLSAIIPASISGFGARELAAVSILALLNVRAETAFSASFLFGICGTLQGILGVYFWVKRDAYTHLT